MGTLAGGNTAFDLETYSDPSSQGTRPGTRALSMEELFPVRHYEPPRDAPMSGRELRHRVVTPQVLAAIDAEDPKPSLMQRLFRRR